LYLQSVRTGPSSNDFGRLFDRADPGSIVASRGESVVAPQALFFMNDPIMSETAHALAARIARDAPQSREARIHRLYAVVLNRPPAPAELSVGLQLSAPDGSIDVWERYCEIFLCQNEVIYVD
jgi:hypothetical protein